MNASLSLAVKLCGRCQCATDAKLKTILDCVCRTSCIFDCNKDVLVDLCYLVLCLSEVILHAVLIFFNPKSTHFRIHFSAVPFVHFTGA